MSRQLTLIVGLPGSGKTYLGEEISTKTGATFIDDPKEVSVPNSGDVVISDCFFCRSQTLESAIEKLSPNFDKVAVIYFENDPVACRKNVEFRDDGREVSSFITISSEKYFPPSNAIPVWNKESK